MSRLTDLARRVWAGEPYTELEMRAAQKVLAVGIPCLVVFAGCLPSFLRARDFLAGAPITDALAYVNVLGATFWGVVFAVVTVAVLVGQVCATLNRRWLLPSILAHGSGGAAYLVYICVLVQGANHIGWANGWKGPAGAFAALTLHVVLFFLRISLKAVHDVDQRLRRASGAERSGDGVR